MGGFLILVSLISGMMVSLVGGWITTEFGLAATSGGLASGTTIPEQPGSIIDAFAFLSNSLSFFWNAVTLQAGAGAPGIISVIFYIIILLFIVGIVLVIRGV